MKFMSDEATEAAASLTCMWGCNKKLVVCYTEKGSLELD